jgi:hypothetical protein
MQAWITNISTTNATLLNGVAMETGVPSHLADGDAFFIAGRTFKFYYREWAQYMYAMYALTSVITMCVCRP